MGRFAPTISAPLGLTRSFRSNFPLPLLQSFPNARLYSQTQSDQVAATRSTIAQLLRQIDSKHTAQQYLSYFSTPTFSARPFAVIKVGGAILTDHLPSLASAIAFLSHIGLYPILVHGAGPQLNTSLSAAGVKPEFHEGIRVTDGRTLALARTALLEENFKLAQELESIGVSTRPLTSGVFQAEYLDASKYGHVGRIVQIEDSSIQAALRASCVPVVTCMAETSDGQVLNVHADLAASALARALRPEKVVYLSETGGLVNGRTGRKMDVISLEWLREQEWTRLGMRWRVRMRAVREMLEGEDGEEARVSIVHPRGLLKEVFAGEGQGEGTVIRRARNTRRIAPDGVTMVGQVMILLVVTLVVMLILDLGKLKSGSTSGQP
ncbi:acetylglutamate kinase [Aspergillus saccharolyticus JOP 1030-1]|uniref:Acetylglutamate kinase n=1 Tax=Aspergillus saccharolyticus JOP 1030-1 TaxID=1450539 RepID=A0A318ZQA2_9EURO|nr:acetylglutamate kinase [Aspergillus saccharolyticus JOP 1030-1]PYH49801.1 acetylglutamate kinase [Aspergillus saccharolyticus JOP 1030-1]